MEKLLLTSSSIAALVASITFSLKKAGLPKEFLPLASWVVGGLLGIAIYASQGGSILYGLIMGILGATVANGGHDQIKGLKKKLSNKKK